MAFSKKIREEVYSKLNGKCGYCGEDISIKDMQIDHIVPQARFLHHVKNQYKLPKFLEHLTEFDLNHIDNLMPTCRVCNKWKSDFCLELFRSELSKQVKRLNSYSTNYRIAKKYGLIEETGLSVRFYFEYHLEALGKIIKTENNHQC